MKWTICMVYIVLLFDIRKDTNCFCFLIVQLLARTPQIIRLVWDIILLESITKKYPKYVYNNRVTSYLVLSNMCPHFWIQIYVKRDPTEGGHPETSLAWVVASLAWVFASLIWVVASLANSERKKIVNSMNNSTNNGWVIIILGKILWLHAKLP